MTISSIISSIYVDKKVNLFGLDITIELNSNDIRTGTDKSGKSWATPVSWHYGYFNDYIGADDEELDVFVGPYPNHNEIFIVNQYSPDGKFDEHKVMIGFKSQTIALQSFYRNFGKDWLGYGTITDAYDTEEFLKILPRLRQKSPIS